MFGLRALSQPHERNYVGVVNEFQWISLLGHSDDLEAFDALAQIPNVTPKVVAELFWGRLRLKVMDVYNLPLLFLKVYRLFHAMKTEEVVEPFQRIRSFNLPDEFSLRRDVSELLIQSSFDEAAPLCAHLTFFSKMIESVQQRARAQLAPLWNDISGAYHRGRDPLFIKELAANFFSVSSQSDYDLANFFLWTLSLKYEVRDSLFRSYRNQLFTIGMLLTLFSQEEVSLRVSILALQEAIFPHEDSKLLFKKLLEFFASEEQIDYEDKEALFNLLQHGIYGTDDALMREIGEKVMALMQLPYTDKSLKRVVIKTFDELYSSNPNFKDWEAAYTLLKLSQAYNANYKGYCKFYRGNAEEIIRNERERWIVFLKKFIKELENVPLENRVFRALKITEKCLSAEHKSLD